MAFIENLKQKFSTVDVNGYKMPIKRFDGIDFNFVTFSPDNIHEHLEDIKNLEIREDDVFICTYPRSGSNWTDEIVRMLHKGNDTYYERFVEHFDIMPKNVLDSMKSPRVGVSHFPFRFLPRQLAEKGKIICTFRNPKAVAVSTYYYMLGANFAEVDGTFSDFLKKVFLTGGSFCGQWFQYAMDWEKTIEQNTTNPILPLFYEDMHKDLRGNVEKIANFIGAPHNPELFDRITEKCTAKNMLPQKKANVPKVIANLSKDGGHFLYRKGELDDWKNYFTVAENEEFDNIFKEEMKDSKLFLKYLYS